MDIRSFIDGVIIGFSASVPLGPIGVICIQKTINKGRWSGLVSGAGAAGADTFFAIIAGFGLTFITDFITEKQLYLRIAGSIILLILGLKMFLTNPAIQIRRQRFKKKGLFSDFISVFFLTLSNPLTVLFFGAVFAGFGVVKEESDFLSVFFMVVGIFVGALAWWVILTTTVNHFRKKFRLKRLWWINKITGAIVILCGIAGGISLFFINSLK